MSVTCTLADAETHGGVNPNIIAAARITRDACDDMIKRDLTVYGDEWSQWANHRLLNGLGKAHRHIKKGEGEVQTLHAADWEETNAPRNTWMKIWAPGER